MRRRLVSPLLVIRIFSLCFYIADIGTDVAGCVNHLRHGDVYFALVTFIFISINSVIMIHLCYIWHIHDVTNTSANHVLNPWELRLRLLVIFAGLGPLVAFFDSIRSAWYKQQKKERKHLGFLSRNWNRGIGVMSMLETSLEAFPQSFIQSYIIIKTWTSFQDLSTIHFIQIIMSIIYSSWNTYKGNRILTKCKIFDKLYYFPLYVFSIGLRVLSLSMLGTVSLWWVSSLVGLRFIIFASIFYWYRVRFLEGGAYKVSVPSMIYLIATSWIWNFTHMYVFVVRKRWILMHHVLLILENIICLNIYLYTKLN